MRKKLYLSTSMLNANTADNNSWGIVSTNRKALIKEAKIEADKRDHNHIEIEAVEDAGVPGDPDYRAIVGYGAFCCYYDFDTRQINGGFTMTAWFKTQFEG